MSNTFTRRRGQYRPPPSCKPGAFGRPKIQNLLTACPVGIKRCIQSIDRLTAPPGGLFRITADVFDDRWDTSQQWDWVVTGDWGNWIGPAQIFNGIPLDGDYQAPFSNEIWTITSEVFVAGEWICRAQWTVETQEEGGGGGGDP